MADNGWNFLKKKLKTLAKDQLKMKIKNFDIFILISAINLLEENKYSHIDSLLLQQQLYFQIDKIACYQNTAFDIL